MDKAALKRKLLGHNRVGPNRIKRTRYKQQGSVVTNLSFLREWVYNTC